MENRLILTSKTSVAYSMTLVVFMFFAVIGIVIFSHIESKWSPYFQGFIAIGYLLRTCLITSFQTDVFIFILTI